MKPRKVYWEEDGWSRESISFCVYFYPRRGRGTFFSVDGKRETFGWVNPKEANKGKFRELPKDIQYSLLHQGEFTLTVPRDKIQKDSSLTDLIKASTSYRMVNKSQVKSYKRLKKAKLKTLGDVKLYEEEIRNIIKIGIPSEFTSKVLELGGSCNAEVINGELGLATFCDYLRFKDVLNSIGIKI